jgi:hypothetical protein
MVSRRHFSNESNKKIQCQQHILIKFNAILRLVAVTVITLKNQRSRRLDKVPRPSFFGECHSKSTKIAFGFAKNEGAGSVWRRGIARRLLDFPAQKHEKTDDFETSKSKVDFNTSDAKDNIEIH